MTYFSVHVYVHIHIFTSKCGLQPRLLRCACWGLPMAGLSTCSAVEMYVTMDRIGIAKVQRFIGKGISQIVYVRFANLLSMRAGVNRCSIVCNPKVLVGKGQTVTPLRGVLFPLGGKRNWSSSCTSGSRSVAIAYICVSPGSGTAHSTGSLPGPACA